MPEAGPPMTGALSDMARQMTGFPGSPLAESLAGAGYVPPATRMRSPGFAAALAAARPLKGSASVPLPPPPPGAT